MSLSQLEDPLERVLFIFPSVNLSLDCGARAVALDRFEEMSWIVCNLTEPYISAMKGLSKAVTYSVERPFSRRLLQRYREHDTSPSFAVISNCS